MQRVAYESDNRNIKNDLTEGSATKPNIDLSDEQREGVIAILNSVLSDEYVLYTKTRNYHWDVTGPQFNDLHKFFEEQYTELNVVADDVAERAGRWPSGHSGCSPNFHSTSG